MISCGVILFKICMSFYIWGGYTKYPVFKFLLMQDICLSLFKFELRSVWKQEGVREL